MPPAASSWPTSRTRSTAATTRPLGTAVITSNVWHHAAVTYSGSTLQLLPRRRPRPDGRRWRARSCPRRRASSTPAVGTAMTSTGVAAGFFQGVVDEVRDLERRPQPVRDPGRQEHRDRTAGRPDRAVALQRRQRHDRRRRLRTRQQRDAPAGRRRRRVGDGLRRHQRRRPAQRLEPVRDVRRGRRDGRAGRVRVHPRAVVQADRRGRRARAPAPAGIVSAIPLITKGRNRGRDAGQPEHELLLRDRCRDRHARGRLRGHGQRRQPPGRRHGRHHQQRLASRRGDLQRLDLHLLPRRRPRPDASRWRARSCPRRRASSTPASAPR